MTDFFSPDAARIAAHKRLARRLQDSLRHHAPQTGLSHVQTLHLIAALHGVPDWQTLLARPHRERLPETPALTALGRALEQRGVHLPEPVLTQLLDGLSPLTFTVADEGIEDTPLKTQVALSLVLHGPITLEPLRRLLWAEYERVRTLGGFRYHPRPTSVFIWAYPSEAHHQGGAGQWAGMLQRSAADFQAGRSPQVTVNEERIQAVQAPQTVRYGLPEEIRQAIFRDRCRVEARARIAADDVHPIGYENTREVMRLNTEYRRACLEEWDALLAAQHGLTAEQFHEVVVEGLTRSWPMAAIQDTATETIP